MSPLNVGLSSKKQGYFEKIKERREEGTGGRELRRDQGQGEKKESCFADS